MAKLGRVTLTNGGHLLLIDSSESDRGSTRTLVASGCVDRDRRRRRRQSVRSAGAAAGSVRCLSCGDMPLWLGLGITAPFGMKVHL
jgi:hypothetical protein